jgi:hypothetical protein
MPKTITVTMTLLEAYAVLRALAVANVSDRQQKNDIDPCTWVAHRIVDLLEDK